MGPVTVAVEKLHPYPTWALKGCETALIVFAAEFAGMNDAAWIAEAGLRATCVDINADKLDEMRPMYPADWQFVCADAYTLEMDEVFDVVSLDPFTNHFERCAEAIGRWCGLAKRAVIIGTGTDTTIVSPPGWRQTDCVKRTDYQGGVYWNVLERV